MEVVGEDFTHAAFFAKYGRPDRILDLGNHTYLFYTCKDGRVRVKCPKAPFHYDDDIAPLTVEYD